MRRFQTLSARLGLIGGSLLLVAIASIGFTLWISWQLEGGAAAVNEAGRMRMQTWRLAQTLARGDAGAVRDQILQFDSGMALLRDGDPARPLFVPRNARCVTALADVARTWTEVRAAWSATPGLGAMQAARQAEAFVAHIDALVTAIEQRLASLTTVLNALQVFMMGLTIASAVTMLYSAYLFIFNPLDRLKAGLARVRHGDLAARVQVNSGDEFGALSRGFNQMAETLEELYQHLEMKVEEKTSSLAAQNARLASLYQASEFAARADTLDDLAQGFATRLKRVAHADAVAIRWCDEDNRRYVLLASHGLSSEVADHEACIQTGDCACGQPRDDAHTRVVFMQRRGGAALQGHCERAGYRSLVSVPVRLQTRIVGEIDLFYAKEATLADDDRTLLDALADHLATAIEGLRVSALLREAAVAEERGFIARELHDSIAQSLAFMKIQSVLLRDALAQKDTAKTERAVGELEMGIEESLSDVRELLMHFRTRTNTETILPALQTTLQKFEHQTGMATRLSVEGDGLPLPPDVQVQVLHVVQEALSNVRKHAHARAVSVEVRQSSPWQVVVRDDGCGFGLAGQATGHSETHVGLRIMRERAARIGAAVEIETAIGDGTRVVLTLADRKRLAA
ncbi:type IV pili methyl-accepting chemotaxis transducer N-terminal domain-containing protein [Paraburkholderia phymatum]|uniref:Sensor protein n=1 Tax=Paraburkholderia phymatum (strain DSM 17167 / CIP 108236 / LMG 21445 / STM815) TaxID=391038 RepID=B2JWB1_PARP8|nr:type IV pili methyl-accepting chemotaxis transducer N-terminal domain-containing protein [Paraburkholderia phymatum]ACC75238.1 multi-sensor signal transduction histidine kinase [Paraburkholderia phymatum STM815]